MRIDTDTSAAIPSRIVIIALIIIFGLEVMVLMDFLQYSTQFQLVLTALMIVLPWGTILFTDAGSGALGFHKDRFFLHFGWGMVAGGIWRILSVLFNLWGLEMSGVWMVSSEFLTAVLWVPFIEETFFRGFLGRTLERNFGAVPAVLIQSILFMLLPSHIIQGVWKLVSIFGFGLLAGWLMHVRKSIWAPWGAHAFANLLPLLVLAIN